jgi:hypothetical protein
MGSSMGALVGSVASHTTRLLVYKNACKAWWKEVMVGMVLVGCQITEELLMSNLPYHCIGRVELRNFLS